MMTSATASATALAKEVLAAQAQNSSRSVRSGDYYGGSLQHVVWGDVEHEPSSSGSLKLDVATTGVNFVDMSPCHRSNKSSSSSSLTRHQAVVDLDGQQQQPMSTPPPPHNMWMLRQQMNQVQTLRQQQKQLNGEKEQETAGSDCTNTPSWIIPPDDPVHEIVHDILEEAGSWSEGSSQHGEGLCRPCHYIHTSAGCSSGLKCTFCHFPHTDSRSVKGKVCMSKRLHCKKVAAAMEAQLGHDLPTFRRATWLVSSRSIFLRCTLEERIRELEGAALGQTVAYETRRKHIQSL